MVDRREWHPLRFGRQLFIEDLPEEGVHDGVEALLRESVPVVLRFPHVDVAEPPAGQLHGEVADETFGHLRAESVLDPPVEAGVDRHVLRTFITDVNTTGALRENLTVERAADIVWTLNSSDVYLLLIEERGWSPAEFEQWLADAWARLLLR